MNKQSVKKKNILSGIFIVILALFTSCKEEKDEVTPTSQSTPLTTENLSVTIAENPTQGQVINTVNASGNNLQFSFKAQSIASAFQINNNGQLSVLTPSVFDYEKRTTITAEVNVTDGKDTVVSILTITLNNVLDIGELHKGGIVFWLNPSDKTEGLVCALEDQSAAAPWGCAGTAISGADSKALGDGNQNTIEIEAGCSTTGTATDLCANLTSNNYSDWYLPTENELSEIYSNIGTINSALTSNNGTSFVTSTGGGPYYDGAFYWSSSEHIAQSSIIYDFARGQGSITTKGTEYRVRAIRSF